jgi:hypothetical protein
MPINETIRTIPRPSPPDETASCAASRARARAVPLVTTAACPCRRMVMLVRKTQALGAATVSRYSTEESTRSLAFPPVA